MADKDPIVVVVLPFTSNKVVMQLRDFKQEIAYPGHWGFLGGAVDNNETPLEAALREIEEEIDIKPLQLCFHGTDFIPNHNFSYIFSFKLTQQLSSLELKEGLDIDFITLNDIENKKFYSRKLQEFFPIVPLPFIAKTIRRCLMTKQLDSFLR